MKGKSEIVDELRVHMEGYLCIEVKGKGEGERKSNAEDGK